MTLAIRVLIGLPIDQAAADGAMLPVLAAAHLPIDGVGILLAVDTIPDMFRTTANLTGAMTLTAILPSPQE